MGAFVNPSGGGVFAQGLNLPAATTAAQVFVSVANQVRFVLFTLRAPWKISRFTYNINAGAAGAKIAYAIYSGDGTQKLIDSGPIAADSTTSATSIAVGPVTLPPGDYIFAWTSSNASVSTAWVGNTIRTVPFFSTNAPRLGIAGNVSAAGVMPATLGTLTADSTQSPPICFWSS
jgi:hypothetical protein